MRRPARQIGGGLLFAMMIGVCAGAATTLQADDRVTDGLVVFYDFEETGGDVVHDRSGVDPPLHLRIDSRGKSSWRGGALVIEDGTTVRSDGPATKVYQRVGKSNAITIEAWVAPRDTDQDGPARIVSLSRNTSERNFTLGQENSRYDVRLRTTRRSNNGLPSVGTPPQSLHARLTHVVYTRDRKGVVRVYLNGKRVAHAKVDGDLSNWDAKHFLMLGNEKTNDRPWLGSLHLVAIYDRALSERDVARNFEADGDGIVPPPTFAQAKLFDEQIVPLLSKHCLDCHGWKAKKGRLDLTRRSATLAERKTGRAIVPGKHDQSLVWESVFHDEMPKDRPPLSKREKEVLKKWIDGGAAWTVARLDRATYATEAPAGETWIRRLTVDEYIATVKAAVGVDIATEARELLPRDLRADGFSNTAYNLNVDLKHVEAYARLAEVIVSRMDVATLVSQAPCRELDDGCMKRFIERKGAWLLRGPLDKHEVESYLAVTRAVKRAGGDFEEGVRYVVLAMLQSPRFIYRMEQQTDEPDRVRSEFELASRLSYIIWGAPPDRQLMDAAVTFGLSDRALAARQVERMLRDPRAVEQSLRFASEWLHLDRMDYMRPNPKRFPRWNDQLAQDMRRETLAVFKHIAWDQRRPLADLLDAQVTFLTPSLAKHYGLSPRGSGLRRYDLSADPSRGGLLTHGSILTIGGDDASMVTRGLFVLHDLLDGSVDAPPPGLDTTPVPSKPGLSQRMIAESRIADSKCGGCHARFEPLAFGLERYNGVGAYSTRDEHRNTLRQDGSIVFPGTKREASYKTAAEMMRLLAGSDRVKRTITKKLTQFALGRPIGDDDEPLIDEIHAAAQKAGGTYSDVITAIVLSDAVLAPRD